MAAAVIAAATTMVIPAATTMVIPAATVIATAAVVTAAAIVTTAPVAAGTTDSSPDQPDADRRIAAVVVRIAIRVRIRAVG
ncbi:MAG: hypothetical protein WDO13_08970 [Verrucomicrobiota bacterium]